MARKFVTSTFKRYCSICKKPIPAMTEHRYNHATNERVCVNCTREAEVVHHQAKPGTKRAAMPA